jgi:hypothetical protein
MCEHNKLNYSKEYKTYWCTDCLLSGMSPRRKRWRYLTATAVFLICLFTATKVRHYQMPRNFTYEKPDIELSDSAIMAALIEEHVTMPGVALLQMKAECTDPVTHMRYRSKICIENKNLLGIKYVGQKEALGEKNDHAYYATYRDCIKDYKRLEKYYLPQLEKKYSEAGAQYTELLKQLDKGL